jgi:hypothetical protein
MNDDRERWRCQFCDVVSEPWEWREAPVACRVCGGHTGRECPWCHKQFDMLWMIPHAYNPRMRAAPCRPVGAV